MRQIQRVFWTTNWTPYIIIWQCEDSYLSLIFQLFCQTSIFWFTFFLSFDFFLSLLFIFEHIKLHKNLSTRRWVRLHKSDSGKDPVTDCLWPQLWANSTSSDAEELAQARHDSQKAPIPLFSSYKHCHIVILSYCHIVKIIFKFKNKTMNDIQLSKNFKLSELPASETARRRKINRHKVVYYMNKN